VLAPLHKEKDLDRSRYTPVEHISHVTGIAISSFFIVAALATLLATLYEVFCGMF
jgi:hypothetical protein